MARKKKQTYQDKFNKFKGKAKEKYNQVKSKATAYARDLGDYYEIGYQKGWNDCKNGNSPFGASFVGGVGYAVGYRNKKRTFKYNNHQKRRTAH